MNCVAGFQEEDLRGRTDTGHEAYKKWCIYFIIVSHRVSHNKVWKFIYIYCFSQYNRLQPTSSKYIHVNIILQIQISVQKTAYTFVRNCATRPDAVIFYGIPPNSMITQWDTILYMITWRIQALSLVESNDLIEDRRTELRLLIIKVANSIPLFVYNLLCIRVVFVKFQFFHISKCLCG